MKIVCDNCATKYSIADEKVRGKVFKIRCKKCSHIIVVRGGADGSVEATSSRDAGPADGGFPGGGEEQQTIAARGASGAEAGGDAVWHLVIDREQVGPLSPSEVRAKFSGGEVDAETYAWREGFGDWLRLGSIEDFRDLGGDAPAAPEATRRTDSADLFGGGGGEDAADAPAGDLFGGGAAPAPAYSSAPAPAANEDVFGGGGGGALFSAPSAAPQRQSRASSPAFSASSASAESAPSSSHGNGNVVDVRPMTGQRNENSVLFSLNNLQALATGGAGGGKAASSGGGSENRPGFANSQTEGSGLIDIRAMAASTLAASPSTGGIGSGPGELPGLGAAPVFSPMAAPILMPAAPSGPPKWMWAILGVGVLAVLGIVVVGVLLLTRKPAAEPTMAQGPAAPAPTAPVAAAPSAATAKPNAAAPAAPAAAAPAAAAPVAAAASPAAEKHPGKAAKGGGEKATKLAKNEPAAAKAPAAAPEPVAAAPAAPAAKHSGKRDELDDLLNNASPGGDTPKPHKAAAAAKDDSGGGASDDSLPDTLDKGQIVSGMSKVKGRVQGCFDQYKVPGTASVAITIANSGRVSSANVTGQFAGTPTGECVAKAVKTAGFTRFKGSPMSFVYPYLLR